MQVLELSNKSNPPSKERWIRRKESISYVSTKGFSVNWVSDDRQDDLEELKRKIKSRYARRGRKVAFKEPKEWLV